MSTFNEIEMTTPYGDTDNVLELNIDSSSDAYVLKNVIKLPSTYTFSIWYRTENDSQITFNVLGESETANSTTSWNKFIKTVTVETLDETSIYIIPSVGMNSYFYEGYLVEGITDTSWLPAPEDIESEIGSVRSELRQTAESILLKVSDSNGRITTLETNLEGITGRVEDAEGNISKVSQTVDGITTEISDAKGSSTTLQSRLEGIDSSVVDAETNAKSFATQEAERIQNVVQNNIDNVESNFTQRADDIELNVAKKKDNPLTAIRYIRDWLNGDTSQNTNRWVACKAVSNNTDIANGLTATLLSSDGTVVGVQPSNIDVYTNGDTSSEIYIDSGSNDLQCLQLDLGKVRNDIDYIQVFHYYEDSRTYNHKFEVSSDGENWISLYNSVIQGGYSESASGMIYNISDTVYHDQYASLSVKLNEIESTVYDGMENINQSISTAEGNIKNIYGQLENVESNINTTINNLPDKNYVQTKIEEKAGQISTEIKTVENGLETKISKVVQDSDKWLINFAKLGMENSPGISTIIKLSEEGIRVSQSDGSEVLIDGNGLQGFYNNLAVFQLKKDLTITERTQISNGADFTTLKYINREYQTSNGTTKCLVHVVSGGSS